MKHLMKNIVLYNGLITKKSLIAGEGKTGFPIIDAAMNELNETGFMHNRMRMVALNF